MFHVSQLLSLLLQMQSDDIMGLSPYQLVTVTITATTGGGTSDLSDEEIGRSSEAGAHNCYLE